MAKKICDYGVFVAIQAAVSSETIEGDTSLAELAEKYPDVIKSLGYEYKVAVVKERLKKEEARILREEARECIRSAGLIIDQTPNGGSYRPASHAVQAAREAVTRAIKAPGFDSQWLSVLRRDLSHVESLMRRLRGASRWRHQRATPTHRRKTG
jgi:hypothetical protein